MPVLDAWAAVKPDDFPNYAAGSWGPEAVQSLLENQDHRWPQPAELIVRSKAKQR
jgi:glucose-6-phosphate 1-dehydrogenase